MPGLDGTMQASLSFHGELNDLLSADRRGEEVICAFASPRSVKDMMEAQEVPHPEVGRIVVNGNPAGFDYLVRNGDRIEVYPCSPSMGELSALPCFPSGNARFVLDVHLGTLAAYLRLLGFDTLYQNDYGDEEIALISAQEERILLTRDIGLLKRSVVRYGRFVRARQPAEQLREIVGRYALSSQTCPFRRCLRCNGCLREVAKDLILDSLPEGVAARFQDFKRCDQCARIYWAGSHLERMRAIIGYALEER